MQPRDDTAQQEPAAPRGRLLRRERRLVVVAAVTPVAVAAALLAPIGDAIGAGVADVVVAALVYGGLLGLAAAFVAVDRFQSRQCPRCTARPRGAERCPACGYDLRDRPRYACERRHRMSFDPGMCTCGRRLLPLPTPRGIRGEIVFMLKLGVWLLALLIGMGIALRLLEGAG